MPPFVHILKITCSCHVSSICIITTQSSISDQLQYGRPVILSHSYNSFNISISDFYTLLFSYAVSLSCISAKVPGPAPWSEFHDDDAWPQEWLTSTCCHFLDDVLGLCLVFLCGWEGWNDIAWLGVWTVPIWIGGREHSTLRSGVQIPHLQNQAGKSAAELLNTTDHCIWLWGMWNQSTSFLQIHFNIIQPPTPKVNESKAAYFLWPWDRCGNFMGTSNIVTLYDIFRLYNFTLDWVGRPNLNVIKTALIQSLVAQICEAVFLFYKILLKSCQFFFLHQST